MGVLRLALPLFLLSSSCLAQQQQQTHPQLVNQPTVSHQVPQNIQDSVIPVQLESAEAPVTNHYPYQSTQLAPSSTYHHYPNAGSNYGSRDVYNANQGWSAPYFGVTTGTAWELSAYFGPVFWAFVAIVATFGFCVGVSRFILGGDIFGGMFQRIKDSAPSGKSLDMDNITNVVYQALDTYGKYVAKEARQGSTQNIKG